MKNGKFLKLVLVPVGLMGLLAAGCSTTPSWNVSITKTTPATIQVDLIGIRKADHNEWAGRNITEYWSQGSKVREEADKLTYNLKMGEPVVLQHSDPKWQEWLSHGTQELLIIANLPHEFPPGGDDPRRKFLPLGSKDWTPVKKNTLEIEVKETRINVLTPQK